MTTLLCMGCGKRPSELREYIDAARELGISPEEYVQGNEGTYNPDNGHFACDECYIRMGMPVAPEGWKAP